MGHVKTTRFLVRMGSDVHAVRADARTPLHSAAACGRVGAVRVLVENVDINSPSTSVQPKHDDGNTKQRPYSQKVDLSIFI
jgi:ankyrin repeat protein